MAKNILLLSLLAIFLLLGWSNAFPETPQINQTEITSGEVLALDSTGKLFHDSKSAPEGIRSSSRVYSDTYYEHYKFSHKWGTYGSGDGEFNYFNGVAIDSSRNVYVADSQNNRIQKFSSDGAFITKWGTSGFGDGEFNYPIGIAVDSSGNVYVADSGNNRIQKFTSDGSFITKLGNYGDGDGEFCFPEGIVVDKFGNVYVADTYNMRIQKFTSDGKFIAKWKTKNSVHREFSCMPSGVALDSHGNIYMTDLRNNLIQILTPYGILIKEWETYRYSWGIAVDKLGNVFSSSIFNNYIQKFTSDGTVLATWGGYGSDDGELSSPEGIAVDKSGNVYVADSGNNRIQVFSIEPSSSKKSDLTVKKVGVPKSVKNNEKAFIEATVRNMGKANAPSSKVSFYLSSYDFNSIGDNDILIGSKTVKKLKTKQSALVKFKWTIAAAPGTYYLKAKCDSKDAIIESNENNNVGVSKQITVK